MRRPTAVIRVQGRAADVLAFPTRVGEPIKVAPLAFGSLVVSQVVVSFGIPFALIPLPTFCRNRDVTGALVNHRATTAIASMVVALGVCLNVFLLYRTFLGRGTRPVWVGKGCPRPRRGHGSGLGPEERRRGGRPV